MTYVTCPSSSVLGSLGDVAGDSDVGLESRLQGLRPYNAGHTSPKRKINMSMSSLEEEAI